MDKQQARDIIKETFEQPFDKVRFTAFIKNLLNRIEETPTTVYRGNLIPDAYEQYISSLERIGKYTDGEHKIDILIVKLKKETSLERARTMQRNFIAWYLNGSRGGVLKDAALVAYISPDETDWRFSLVKMDYKFEETPTGLSACGDAQAGKMKVKEEFTPARRWSFLVGVNEKSHTAQSRLVKILAEVDRDPALAELEEVFNIETVTKEFFLKYRDLFVRTKEELDKVVKNDARIQADFETKGVNTVDFAKKLLGQIVFLYFLQKKGWFGVGRDADWGTGSKQFLRELFEKKHRNYNNFFNDILESLFYEALRIGEERKQEDYYYSNFNCKIPFLNGGLFDPIGNYDWVCNDIYLPDDLFSNTGKTKEGDIGDGILDIFDRYNFTVKEDEPLEKEVAIDPELLGKAYEKFNAIRPDNFEEYKKALKSGKKGDETKFNKQFGVYYTPREIVHYMCQQSLINYLATELTDRHSSESWNPVVLKEDIEILIHVGEQVSENEEIALIKEQNILNGKQKSSRYDLKLPESIRKNAKLIDDKLSDITVCDPAVGSGAFPVGMMNEIVRARNVLSTFITSPFSPQNSPFGKGGRGGIYRGIYEFKRRCIEHSLYGVDIDPGAVEIAKLRLWLSLVVDEDDIKNIKPLPNLDYKIVCGNSLLGVEKDVFNYQLFNELERLKPLLFNETNPTKKQEYKKQIDALISQITNGHKEFDFEVYFSEVFHQKGGFDVVIGNPPYFNVNTINKDLLNYLAIHYKAIHSGYNDIVYYFIYLGIELLKKTGCCVLITSNYYLGNEYAKKLRAYLKTHTSKIINFKDYMVFDAASIHTCISVSFKEPASDEITFLDEPITDRRLSSSDIESELRSFTIKRSELNDNWIIAAQSNTPIFEKLKKKSVLLGDISMIAKGSESGKNFVFTITADAVDKFKIEKNIVRKCIKNSNIKKYFIDYNGLYLLYVDNDFEPSVFKYTFEYLKNYKSQLLNRRGPLHQEYEWYRLHRPSIKEVFDANEKLVVPYRAERNCFAYDSNQYFNDGGDIRAIVINNSKFSIKYVLAILNSTLIDWFYGFIGKPKGKVREYFNTPLSLIPIKILSLDEQQPFIKLVDRILIAKQNNPQVDTSALERQIDQMVYKLYGLTAEEIAIVEGNARRS